MNLIHKSDFFKFSFDESNSIMEYEWYPSTEQMSVEQFKKEMLKNAEQCEIYKPKWHLVDTRNFFFPITPELQEWSNLNIINHLIESGMRKTAFVMSQDFFAQLSVEQMMQEEIAANGTKSRFFESVEDAKEWLLS